MMKPQDTLLSNSDAAKFLSVSTSFLNNDRVTRRHGIPFLKVGKLVRYRESDLRAWLDRRVHANGMAA